MNNYTIIDQTQSNPMVSVAMLTYNHEKFIVEAIESVLSQKVNFYVQLVIAEDCSPDSTRAIILDYQKKHPDKIKLILQNKNVGASLNNIALLSNLSGKYVAALEGDDYWTNPLKLQKQVDFLEANNDYSMICHNAMIVYEDSDKEPIIFSKIKSNSQISMQEILTEWIIPTASMVFRSECIKKLPIWFGEIYSGDFTLALLIRNHGKVFFLNENMSVYRVSHTGTSATATVGKNALFVLDQHTKLLNYFNEETQEKYSNLINHKLNSIKKEKAFIEAKKKGMLNAFISMPIFFIKKVMFKIINLAN